MKNKSTKATCRRGISLLAAAALTAALMGGQVYSVLAENTEKTMEVNTLFPDNITISDPVALSEVSLPKSEYGMLTWADEAFVPSKRVQSCEVILKPFKDIDLSDRKGWDSKKEAVVGYVTIVVSSIEGDSSEENDWEDSGTEEIFESSTSTEGNLQETEDADSQNTAEDSNLSIPQEAGDDQEEIFEGQEMSDKDHESEASVSEKQEQKTEISKGENQTKENESSEGTQDEQGNESAPSDQIAPEGQDQPTTAREDGETGEEHVSDMPENIFEQENIPEDNRSTEIKEDVSEEEILQLAAVNHSCGGIYVSGIELPWYVQFRATSGESYEFSNETEASIFKSYEFELWDLRNNTEYEIPDGEYISVTIPVKEGYEYTVEHILDNGATETIIPSLEGNTMVFSTHSFSPFGIAGSKPILYPEIGEDVYDDAAPTPTPTAVPTKTATPTPASNKITSTPVPTTGAAISSGGKENSGNSGSIGNTGNAQNAFSNGNGTGTNKKAAENTVSSKDTNGRNVVNTGDYTRILPFIILFAAAAVIIVGVVVYLKKRK